LIAGVQTRPPGIAWFSRTCVSCERQRGFVDHRTARVDMCTWEYRRGMLGCQRARGYATMAVRSGSM